MQIAVFDTHSYDREALLAANQKYGHEFTFFESRLNRETVQLAAGFTVVCPFVNDRLDAFTVQQLAAGGTKLIALRAAGYNGIDVAAAKAQGLRIVRVPAYSPHAVAEHAFALLLSLVRKIHRAHNRVRELNFSLDGLVGFDLYGKTFGVLGAGRIGRIAAEIAQGFGCRVLVVDPQVDSDWVAKRHLKIVGLRDLLEQSDIVSIHVPLTAQNQHLFNETSLSWMKPGAILINTSRGGLVETTALIEALKTNRLGGVGLDVYELEEGVFFEDHSNTSLQDDQLARLLTFPNVLITSHQAFLTREALANIADTTLESVRCFAAKEPFPGEVVVL